MSDARRGDDGYVTITEVMISSALLIMLLAIVLVTFNVFINLGDAVNAQYKEYDQLLPAMAQIKQFARAEVEPGPTAYEPGNSSPPTPPYASIGNFSVTFYSNVGNANGPAKIWAGETDSSGVPTSTCSTTLPCEFQVKEYLPLTTGSPSHSTCPIKGQPLTNVCQYGAAYKLVTNVIGVTNDPSQIDGTGAPTQPVFTYNLFDPGNDLALNPTPGDVANHSVTLSGTPYNTGYAGSQPKPPKQTAQTSTSLTTCNVPSATYPYLILSCPADTVQSLGIDLRVAMKRAGTNGTVENQTIVYRDQGNSQAPTLPFQFTQQVG